MQLPIDEKDLDTIISALSLGGDTRLYFLLKNIRDTNNLEKEVYKIKESVGLVLVGIQNTMEKK